MTVLSAIVDSGEAGGGRGRGHPRAPLSLSAALPSPLTRAQERWLDCYTTTLHNYTTIIL